MGQIAQTLSCRSSLGRLHEKQTLDTCFFFFFLLMVCKREVSKFLILILLNYRRYLAMPNMVYLELGLRIPVVFNIANLDISEGFLFRILSLIFATDTEYDC